MTADVSSTATAPYVHLRAAPGGGIKRWLLHLVLRIGARNSKISVDDIVRLRRHNEIFDRRFGKIDPALRRTPLQAGGVTAEWIEAPESRADRVLFYLHGGAFCLRFPRTHAAMVGRWCRRLGARALMVDYRLAPEHRYPAAVDDSVAAYRWLLSQVDARQVVVGGDSAGGNLALALLHRLKAEGSSLPRCAVLLSPVVDFTLSSPSLLTNGARDPMFTLAKLAAFRQLYAEPEKFLEPTLSPLFGDFTGFPPLLFQVGEIEMLRDESLRAAARAHRAEVQVEVDVWRAMAHVFQALPLPQATVAEARIAAFVARNARWTA